MEDFLNIIKNKYELILSIDLDNTTYNLLSNIENKHREKILPENHSGAYEEYINNYIFRYIEFETEKEKDKFSFNKIVSELNKDSMYSFVSTFRLNKELRNKRFTYLRDANNIIMFVEDLTKYRLDAFLETIKKTNTASILFEIKKTDIYYHAIYISNSLGDIFKTDSNTILKQIKNKHIFDYLSSEESNQILEKVSGKEEDGFQADFVIKLDNMYFKINLKYIQIGKKLFVYVIFNDITDVFKLDKANTELITTREKNVELELKNKTDALTGLGNEALYLETTRNLNERIKNGFKDYAFLVCDVNGIKITNDTYGHEFGCHLIVSAGHTFPDYFSTSHMFHLGGDEFVIIVEGEDYKNLNNILTRLRNILEYQYVEMRGIKLRLSVAIGYSKHEDGDVDYKDCFKRADSDMYVKKVAIKTKHHIPGR